VVRPVGSAREIPFDARVIAATNQDLEAAVEDRAFRADLYFRLNVVKIAVPPLRARSGDVLLLAQRFLDRLASRTGKQVTAISPAAAERLLAYHWPGNVRELENAIEHGVALARHDQLAVEDLPDKLRSYREWQDTAPSPEPDTLIPMHEVERRYIEHVLARVGGNKRRAASILGFDRATLYRKIARYKIETDGADS
jgi:two-component system response regulator HydG